LSGFNQVSSFVRHLLAFGSFAGETPALPARCELFSSTPPPPNSLKVQTPGAR
jgi:hypothetical protein